MDGEAWLATVDGVAKSQTWLRDFTSLHFWILQISCLVSSRFSEFLLFFLFFATEAADLVLATQDSEEAGVITFVSVSIANILLPALTE